MHPIEINLKFTRGATLREIISLTEIDDTPVNLSGCTLRSLCRKSNYSYLQFNLNPTILSAASGTIQLLVSGTSSSGISFGFGVYDVEITYPNTMDVKIGAYGNCLILPGVTRGESGTILS